MNLLNNLILILLGLFLPFQTFKVFNGLNFTYFDFLISIKAILYFLENNSLPKMSKLYWKITFLIIICSGLSTVFSINFINSVDYFYQIIFLFIVFIPFFKVAVEDFEKLNIFLFSLYFSSIFIALNSLLILFTKDSIYFSNGVRFIGLFDKPNMFAWTCILVLPYLLYLPKLFFKKNKLLENIFMVLPLMGIILVINATQSRTAFLCVLLTVGFLIYENRFYFFNLFKNKNSLKIKKKIIFIFILLILISMISVQPEFLDTLNRFTKISSSGRIDDLVSVIENIDMHKFLFGIGLGNSQYLSDRSIGIHNYFLSIIVEGGFITFLAMIILFIQYFNFSIKNLYCNDGNLKIINNLSFLSLLIFNIVLFFNIPSNYRMFWLPFAFLELIKNPNNGNFLSEKKNA